MAALVGLTLLVSLVGWFTAEPPPGHVFLQGLAVPRWLFLGVAKVTLAAVMLWPRKRAVDGVFAVAWALSALVWRLRTGIGVRCNCLSFTDSSEVRNAIWLAVLLLGVAWIILGRGAYSRAVNFLYAAASVGAIAIVVLVQFEDLSAAVSLRRHAIVAVGATAERRIATLVLSNPNPDVLVIRSVSVSCECAQVLLQPSRVPPRGEGLLKVEFPDRVDGVVLAPIVRVEMELSGKRFSSEASAR